MKIAPSEVKTWLRPWLLLIVFSYFVLRKVRYLMLLTKV